MPNQITHYYFSQDVYNSLSGRAREIIEKYPHAYRVGAVGPDFMYVPREVGIGRYPRYANEMQYLRMYEVFSRAGEYIINNNNECMTAYMLGLYTHYAIDQTGHAYVNYFMEEVMGKYFPMRMQLSLHALLEAGIDETVLIDYIKTNPRTYNAGKDLKPTRYEKEQIAELYKKAINPVIGFPVSKSMIKFAIRLSIKFFKFTCDKRGIKKRLANKYEDYKNIKKKLSSIIRPPYLYGEYDYMNRNQLPWRKVRNEEEMTTESFDMLMSRSKEMAIKYIDSFMDYIYKNKSLNKKSYTINYEGVRVY